MNITTRLLDSFMRKAGSRYARGEMTREEIIEYRMRVERLRDRNNWLKVQRSQGESRQRRLAHIEHVREVIARGGTIAAFDTEFRSNGPVEQLGISLWQNGVITTHTFTLDHLVEAYQPRPSLYGSNLPATVEGMIRLAQETYASADVNVFHSYASDAEKLQLELHRNRYVDTSRLSHLHLNGRVPGLKDICAFYGIELEGHHNAGNDAYHTLQALLAIVNDPWNELSHDPVLQERFEAQRRIIMHPTRLPIPDPVALEDLRKRAQAAYDRFCEKMARQRRQKKAKAERATKRQESERLTRVDVVG